MTLDILRKTGGWCVELQQPLKGHNREVAAIEIRPTTADHIIRWSQGRIPSILALLSELCDVPEALLRQIQNQDFDRVLMAMHSILPTVMKKDWEDGRVQLATPLEDLPETEQIPPPDQLDPRFPAVQGPVVRFQAATSPPQQSPPPDDDPGMNMASPPAMQAVR